MDFKLTDDGDLCLGEQLVDEDGFFLYYIVDEYGKLLPEKTKNEIEAKIPIRDIKTIDGDLEKAQLIKTRLQTENPDWELYENVGASLSDFIGKPNNPITGEIIEKRVYDTLLRGDAFKEEELTVNVIPISHKEVLVDVILDSNNLYLRYAFSLNFDIGINNVYVLDKNGKTIEEKSNKNDLDIQGVSRSTYNIEEPRERLKEDKLS